MWYRSPHFHTNTEAFAWNSILTLGTHNKTPMTKINGADTEFSLCQSDFPNASSKKHLTQFYCHFRVINPNLEATHIGLMIQEAYFQMSSGLICFERTTFRFHIIESWAS